MARRAGLCLCSSLALAAALAPARAPRRRVLHAAVDATSREEQIIALLGSGRVALSSADEATLEELVANLGAGVAPTAEMVCGDWDLLYTSKSAFDPANPLGRRTDGTAPGVEAVFDTLFSRDGAAASSSPIQRFVTSLESVEIRQVVELDAADEGRVDQFVEAADGKVRFRLSASGSLSDGRLDFAFDNAYLDAYGVRLPYPVPFKLLGDEANGFLDTRYVSERLRVSTGNKGTTFILRKR